MVTEGTCCHTGMHRRGFLGLAGGALAAGGVATLLGAAPADAAIASDSDGSLRFAVVTDTHLNVSTPSVTTWATQVLGAITRRNPDFMLHCGDITDTGEPDEYTLYGQTIPDALRGKIHYSPGNHETRWDPTAKELFNSHFGPAPYSFDAAGIHFIGFDPTQVLQEPGHYGPDKLAWLENDLRRMAKGTTAVLFQHFPMGNGFYFVDDQPAVLDLLADFPVRGIIAGHIHREDVTRFNGLTQVGLNAVKNGPIYYWFERTTTEDGVTSLDVTRVTVAPDGSETETPLATMPLDGLGAVTAARPHQVHVDRVTDRSLPVTVRLDQAPAAGQVGMQLYPQAVFGGSSAPNYQALTSAEHGHTWTGSIDVSALAPGSQRLQVRVLATDGSWFEQAVLFTVPQAAGGPTQRWQLPLKGSVQGGIALVDPVRGDMVAASTGGEVVAFRPDRTQSWKTHVGPVYRKPGIDTAGRTVFLPSADHRLYALNAADGSLRWRFDAGAPVLSAPTVAQVGGREQVVFSAGNTLFTVDAETGQQVWSVPGRGFSAGQAACDGERVYTAAADGFARAHDVRTGKPVWSRQMVTGDAHRIALNSGWDTVVAVGADTAVVATVSSATALDTATGAVRWTIPGSTMYAPALIVDGTSILLTSEFGVMTLADLVTGKIAWTTQLGVRVFNAGAAIDGGCAWVVSVDGKLIGVRLADGQRQSWLQHTLVHTFSRPAIAGDTLVVGDQNGIVHGIRLS